MRVKLTKQFSIMFRCFNMDHSIFIIKSHIFFIYFTIFKKAIFCCFRHDLNNFIFPPCYKFATTIRNKHSRIIHFINWIFWFHIFGNKSLHNCFTVHPITYHVAVSLNPSHIVYSGGGLPTSGHPTPSPPPHTIKTLSIIHSSNSFIERKDNLSSFIVHHTHIKRLLFFSLYD